MTYTLPESPPGIRKRPPGKRRFRFIADSMLGKLAKWLRWLGYDVVYFRSISDWDLVHLGRSEDREILTRDRGLPRRKWTGKVRFLIIQDDSLPGQIRQVLRERGTPPANRRGRRCIRCNHPLSEISRSEARPLVPPYVYRNRRRFKQCGICGRVYWRGTHLNRLNARLTDMFSSPRRKKRDPEEVLP